MPFDPTIRPLDEFDQPPVYVAVRDGEVLVDADPPPDGEPFMIGAFDGRPVVAVATEDGHDAFVGLRELRAHTEDPWWSIAGRAAQIVNWDRTHRFCGRCATPTERQINENARVCPRCGLVVYPRLSPAIIVLVTRGARDEEALLVWNQARSRPFYSTIAGFVEPGETLEHAVAREIREETGIEVQDIRYFAPSRGRSPTSSWSASTPATPRARSPFSPQRSARRDGSPHPSSTRSRPPGARSRSPAG